MVSWSIVRVVFCRSIEPVELPVSEAIVSLELIFRVPWTSKFTVSANPPSPLVKFTVALLSISKVPVPVTWSLKSYSLPSTCTTLFKVKVLLPKATAVVVFPSALPKIKLPDTAPLFGLNKADASELKVTTPVNVVFDPELVVNVAAVPPLKLLFPEPAKLISMLYDLPEPVPG